MSQDEIVYISQSLAAAAFYWGVLGGIVGLVLARGVGLLGRAIYRAVRRG